MVLAQNDRGPDDRPLAVRVFFLQHWVPSGDAGMAVEKPSTILNTTAFTPFEYSYGRRA